MFRHHDHKFEWTPEEFREYCATQADRWGYEVEIGGVGVPIEKDPWGRDQELGIASQVAMFKRKLGEDAMKPEFKRSESSQQKHKLVAKYVHLGHPSAHKPRPLQEIANSVRKAMEDCYFDNSTTLWNLWVTEGIAALCGGHFDVLVQAIITSPDLVVSSESAVARGEWTVGHAVRLQKRLEEDRKDDGSTQQTYAVANWEKDQEPWVSIDEKSAREYNTSISEVDNLDVSWPVVSQDDNGWGDWTNNVEDSEFSWAKQSD